MKKGFTLVELLAVIVILGLLIGISLPIYLTISSRIDQSMSETKIQELKAKSEKYAEETGKSVFDVKSLIEVGVLSPDSELGDYKDPVTDRDMSCDIITIQYTNTGYVASITESDECFEEQYLENLFGMVDLYLENEDGQEMSENTWLKESKINVRYRIKPEYQGKGIVSEIFWSGQAPVHCDSTEVNTDKCQKYLLETYENGVKNVEVRLQIKITLNESGASFVSNVSTKVLMDLQSPKIVGNVNLNNEINTSGARRVTFELTDNLGSGVNGYAFTNDFSSGSCSRVSYKETTDGLQTDYLMNGVYGICVKDHVGNVTSDAELQQNQFEVKIVDTLRPTINYEENSINGENGWKKSLILKGIVEDNEGIKSTKYCFTKNSTCIPNIDASLTDGTTTREFEVKINNDEFAQVLCSQAVDLAGNMSELKCSSPYKVDGEQPSQSVDIGTSITGNNNWYKSLIMNLSSDDNYSKVAVRNYCTQIGATCSPNIPYTEPSISITLNSDAQGQYICANSKDYAGNYSDTVCKGPYYVDGVAPILSSVSNSVNGHTMKVTVNASDSHSGNLTYYYKRLDSELKSGGSSYSFTNVPSGGYIVEVYVVDRAGNRSSNTLTTSYTECLTANQVKVIPNLNYGSCSRLCGGGTQYRDYHMDDQNSGKVCSHGQDSQSCNTQDCCSSTRESGRSEWSSCSAICGGGIQYQDIYYVSVFDGSSCPTAYSGASQSCNTMSCCDSQFTEIEKSYGSCTGSCGTGKQYVTQSYISKVTGEYCGSAGGYETFCDTGKSCCTCEVHCPQSCGWNGVTCYYVCNDSSCPLDGTEPDHWENYC